MTIKLRIYLDTSVISACIDTRDPVRQGMTQQFWLALPRYNPYVCPIVLEEISKTPDPGKRNSMLELVNSTTVLPWEEEMERLASAYVASGVFAPSLLQDARHVAAAVVSGIPVLLSWNFRHLVNRTRRLKVNLVNSEVGYGQIDIIAPPELA